MSVEIDPNMPGMDAASTLLDEMIAAEAATTQKADSNATEAIATHELRETQEINESTPTPDSKSPDTRATAEKPAAPEQDKSPKIEDKTASKVEAKADEKSRYAKSQERLNKTWDGVNSEKAAIAADRAKIEADRVEFSRKQAEFQAIQKQSEQPQYKPEDYVQAASNKRQLADHQRAEASRLENDGKYSEAERMTKQAEKSDALSEDLAEHAENLRKNPPKGFTEHAKQFEQARQHYTVEAAKVWPELAQEGSPFQRAVAGHLNDLAKSDPQLMVHPSVIYHVSRLTAAEMQAQAYKADAARVPVLTKELGELKAKVQELQALTTPGGSTSVARLGSPSTADGEAELERMAREVGMLR